MAEYTIKIKIADPTKEYFDTLLANNHIERSEVIGLNFMVQNTIIANNTFANLPNLTKLTGFNNIKQVGDYAFYNCKLSGAFGIITPVIIGKHAFDTNFFTGIVINNNDTIINDSAFANNVQLEYIKFGTNVTTISINNNVFKGCVKLNKITGTNIITSIGDQAFAKCSSFQQQIKLDICTEIGRYAFLSCTNLSNLNAPNCTFVDYNAFKDTKLWDVDPA